MDKEKAHVNSALFKNVSTSEIEKAFSKAIENIVKKECTCKIEKMEYTENIFVGMKIILEIEELRKVPNWNK
jgi:hypothetical protein